MPAHEICQPEPDGDVFLTYDVCETLDEVEITNGGQAERLGKLCKRSTAECEYIAAEMMPWIRGQRDRDPEAGIALVAPDTSPRGEGVPDDPEGGWDFGLGAGFYLNATESPYDRHYQMNLHTKVVIAK